MAAARLRSLGATSFVVDTEEGYVRLGMAGELAGAMGGGACAWRNCGLIRSLS